MCAAVFMLGSCIAMAGTSMLAVQFMPWGQHIFVLCGVLLQTIADMIVYNKSRREARNRLVARSWERPFLKFKVKIGAFIGVH